MRQPTPRPHARRATLVVVLIASFLATSLLPGPSVRAADDIDLLREPGATPYVMIVLDTSASMALGLPTTRQKDDFGDWVPAGADDPDSKLFQVKKALYEVISGVENVHFGFATFNQDKLKVTGKHWLYRPLDSASFDGGTLVYPSAVADTGTTARQQSWVFGPLINGADQIGTCGAPLDPNTDRRKLDRFARLGTAANQPTVLWIAGTNHTYRMTVEPGGAGVTYGDPQITVTLTVDQFKKNNCDPIDGSREVQTVRLARETPFLMVEGDVGLTGVPYSIPASQDSQCASDETLAGYFPYQDVQATGTCGSGASSPFTGDGWDGNSDTPLDRFCTNVDDGQVCYDLRFPTSPDSPAARELSLGDRVPWDWNVEYKDEVLKRLNPLYPEQPPKPPAIDPNTGKPTPADQAVYDRELAKYFGTAGFLEDRPVSLPSGAIELKNESERPLIAFGNSPLARVVNDVRCWYLGGVNDNKCKPSEGGASQFDPGWKALFEAADLFHSCQDRHLILITDGEDNAKGQDAAAETTELNKSDSRFKTTVFSFQDSQVFQRFKSNSDADVILVDNGEDLKQKLLKIIGSIKQSSRTFATAAVPSVQSTTDQNIYITNFEPRNEFGVWEGHLQAFDRNFVTLTKTDPAFLWDSADSMLDQSPAPVTGSTAGTDLMVDHGSGIENARRPYYAQERIPGDSNQGIWPDNRMVFDRTNNGKDDRTASTPTPATLQPGEADFWDGLHLTYDAMDPESVRSTRIRANRIVEDTLIQKSRLNPDGTTQDYLLGDIFHFDPLVVAGPRNTRYFAQDAEETFNTNGDQLGTGYQEFFNQQENRRRVLFAGANDGMLHAFDAGRAFIVSLSAQPPNPARTVVRYGDDLGKEIFAYIPRSVLPTVRDLAESPVSHRWGVDAPAAAGDVFIDPLNDGSPTPSERNWRTVLVGGLREGGAGYYALDITHPDPLKEATIGPSGPGVDPTELRKVLVPQSPGNVVPGCSTTTGGDCDVVPYPAPLWEFYDRVWNPVSKSYLPLDEDGNGYPDLGETWSKATIGRIKVEDTAGDVVNKYVAVVGGGLDPVKADRQGDWLYIIDIETGQAIYKRQVEGSVAADAAAVDTDADGFLDRIYAGTTAGFLYRVDLVGTDSSNNPVYPKLVDVSKVKALLPDQTNLPIQIQAPVHWERIETTDSGGNKVWEPKKIFTTGGRPIYFRPSVIFVANLDRYAVAFGTGDRDDLTSFIDQVGRFYVFVDDSTEPLIQLLLPLDETALTQVPQGSGDHADLLTDPSLPVGSRGWYMVLHPNERVIGNPFAFSGITFFATFTPTRPEDNPDSVLCLDPNAKDCTPKCELDGVSRVYLVGTTDADAFLTDPNDSTLTKRYHEIQGFVTNPFTEQAVTTTSGTTDNSDNTSDRDKLSEAEQKLLEKLQSLFPPNCKFGNHRIDVNVIESEKVSLQRVATVPICIIEKNWKEF